MRGKKNLRDRDYEKGKERGKKVWFCVAEGRRNAYTCDGETETRKHAKFPNFTASDADLILQ